jgi:hypothetical protein
MTKTIEELSLGKVWKEHLVPKVMSRLEAYSQERVNSPWGCYDKGVPILPYDFTQRTNEETIHVNHWIDATFPPEFANIWGEYQHYGILCLYEEMSNWRREDEKMDSSRGFGNFSVVLKTDKDPELYFSAGISSTEDFSFEIGEGECPLLGNTSEKELENYIEGLRNRRRFRKKLDDQFHLEGRKVIEKFSSENIWDTDSFCSVSYPLGRVYSQSHLKDKTLETLQRFGKVMQ